MQSNFVVAATYKMITLCIEIGVKTGVTIHLVISKLVFFNCLSEIHHLKVSLLQQGITLASQINANSGEFVTNSGFKICILFAN